ncbi:hypothetical protein DQW50_09600 [Halorubrum sp. 48-1-W]|nr:hypothetical protein DQW50_09600 [Halorubrum sp. 48-1-W]
MVPYLVVARLVVPYLVVARLVVPCDVFASVSEATTAIAEGLYRSPRLLSSMQTGTTPARRIGTEPESGRSAPTGTCRPDAPTSVGVIA